MDSITRNVRSLYTRYPYPSLPPQLRSDSFPRYLLSYLAGGAPPRPLHLLDVGCGTGAGLIPIATMHPESRVVGVDLSPTAVDAVRTQARQRDLENIEVHQINILDQQALGPLRASAPDGYDVIYASGVLHHLSDPAHGLANLAGLLAPGGLISLMVYGHYGRQMVHRVARAIELTWPRQVPEADSEAPAKPANDADASEVIGRERLAFARHLVSALGQGSVAQPPWNDGAIINDIEFVDRYLHVHARTYTVAELFELTDRVGLRWLRWLEPRLWSPRHIFGPGPIAEALDALPERVRLQVIEQLFDRQSLEVLLAHPQAQLRPVPTRAALQTATIARNPQVAVHMRERHTGTESWLEHLAVRVRGGPEVEIEGIAAALVQTCKRPLPAATLIRDAAQLTPDTADVYAAALHELVVDEVLYAL